MSDHWKAVMNLINDMKMASRSIISTVCYPSTERSKYSNCTVNPGQTRIFWVRPGWPGENVTRVTRMTRPGFNPGMYVCMKNVWRTCMCMRACTHACVRTYVCVCVRVCVGACVCVRAIDDNNKRGIQIKEVRTYVNCYNSYEDLR